MQRNGPAPDLITYNTILSGYAQVSKSTSCQFPYNVYVRTGIHAETISAPNAQKIP